MLEGRIRIVLAPAASGAAPPRAALVGRVVSHDGWPVPGALVEAGKTHGWAYSGTPVAQIVADGDGRFGSTSWTAPRTSSPPAPTATCRASSRAFFRGVRR